MRGPGGLRKAYLQHAVFHFRALGRGIKKQTWQNEVTAPRTHLQDQLITAARKRDLFARRERQLERQCVAAIVSADRVRTSAIQELVGWAVAEERVAQLLEPFDTDQLLVEEWDRPHGHGSELLFDHGQVARLGFT